MQSETRQALYLLDGRGETAGDRLEFCVCVGVLERGRILVLSRDLDEILTTTKKSVKVKLYATGQN